MFIMRISVLLSFTLCNFTGCCLRQWITEQNALTKRRFLQIKRDFIEQNKHLLGNWESQRPLQICLCEGRMNQAIYKVILDENLLSSALTIFPNSENWYFQQDNASCNTARSIKVWMEDHQIKTLSWPAQSPDLNPIENLWNVIKRKMEGHKPSNKAELLEFLPHKRHKVTQHQRERLVDSMPRRIIAVNGNQGYSTKY